MTGLEITYHDKNATIVIHKQFVTVMCGSKERYRTHHFGKGYSYKHVCKDCDEVCPIGMLGRGIVSAMRKVEVRKLLW